MECFEESIKECDLTSTEKVKFRGDQIEFLKILNGYENIDRYNVFLEKDKRTRGKVSDGSE